MVHIMSYFLTVNYAANVFLGMKEKRDRFLQLEEIMVCVCMFFSSLKPDNGDLVSLKQKTVFCRFLSYCGKRRMLEEQNSC